MPDSNGGSVKKKVARKKAVRKKKSGFVFIGNGNDDPSEITAYGYTFKLNGDPVEVKDEFAAKKLAGHSHFKQL